MINLLKEENGAVTHADLPLPGNHNAASEKLVRMPGPLRPGAPALESALKLPSNAYGVRG